MTQLEVQVNTIKETNQELQLQCQKNKDVCETEMVIMNLWFLLGTSSTYINYSQ